MNTIIHRFSPADKSQDHLSSIQASNVLHCTKKKKTLWRKGKSEMFHMIKILDQQRKAHLKHTSYFTHKE